MDGLIIINKPKNCTSHDIVQKTKKILNEKVGHTGTLDPMAQGVLPLLIGKGTKCSKYLINHDKIYQVELKLGIKTTTADIEGEIIEEKQVPKTALQEKYVKEILKTFLGKQQQMPPVYSAIKVNGKKLYEYARKGEQVNIEPRKIEIYDIQLIGINEEQKQITFKVHCSKGTYIRSLCEDIASKLNTVGYMSELKRIKVGNFSINQAITLNELEKDKEKYLIIDRPIINLDKRKWELFLNGVKLTNNLNDGVYRIYNEEKFIGTGTIEKNKLKRDIIL